MLKFSKADVDVCLWVDDEECLGQMLKCVYGQMLKFFKGHMIEECLGPMLNLV